MSKLVDLKGTLLRTKDILKAEIKISKKPIILEIVCGLIDKSREIIKIIFPAILIDTIIGKGNINKALWFIFAFSCSLSILGVLYKILRTSLSAHSYKMTNMFNLTIAQKTMKLDYEDTEKIDSLEKEERATYSLWEFLEVDEVLFNDLLMSIFSLIIMIYIIWDLDIVVLFIILAIVILRFWVDKIAIKKEHEFINKKSKFDVKFKYINDLMLNLSLGKEIRIFKCDDYIINKYDKYSNHVIQCENERLSYDYKIKLVGNILSLIQNMFIYVFAILKFSKGLITIGSFTVYQSAANEISASITKIFNSIIKLYKVNIYFNDYKEYINIEEKIRNTGNLNINVNKTHIPKIEFRNVSFKYPGEESYTLKNISLIINPHEKLSIVGENGSGKTTFVKLLMRLYDVTEGQILMDDVDIKNYKYDDYVNFFAPVFQDFKLFAYTLRENIAFGEKSDDTEILAALKSANMLDKINTLPKGIDTPVSKELSEDGYDLSGGEKQKLAIARAFYKNSPITVLDEPTAALDPISEYEIYRKFNDLSKCKTSIYVSHRMSSSRFCDNIIVFQNGQIVERGKHDELIKRNGVYCDMYNKQAKYYIDIGGKKW